MSTTLVSVLLRMPADDARAQRIRDLKDAAKAADPTVTWAAIAEALDVSARSVCEWARTGAIGHPNCLKLAAYFEVDSDWLWRGPKKAPDLMAVVQAGRDDVTDDVTLEAVARAIAEGHAMLVENNAMLSWLVAHLPGVGHPQPGGELGRDAQDLLPTLARPETGGTDEAADRPPDDDES